MSDILFEQRGHVGLVTLNRVKALNALSYEMLTALEKQLELWRVDDSIASVVVTSASEKAFSAGGDIRDIYERREDPPFAFFRDEYRLDRAIFRYPKPYISLINGIVMGGGAGISMHGRFVVAGEKTTFAMPEASIGFFPDVGGSYTLPRLKGKAGIYCALTGARLKQGDCLHLGMATHTIASAHYETIIERLSKGEDPQSILDALHEKVAPETSAETFALIDDIFSKDTVEDILTALEASDTEFAKKTLQKIKGNSPTSVYVSLEQMKRGVDLDFEDCMIMEFRMVNRILKHDDFYEGVRAALIDKDGAPKWNPARFDSVDPHSVLAHFAPLDDGELTFETS